MDEGEELHFLGPYDLIDYVRVITVTHVYEVLVRRNEWLLSQLRLKVNSKCFNSVTHRIRGLYTRKILQELRGHPHFWWLWAIVFLRVLVALTVVISYTFIVAQATACLCLIRVTVASDPAELVVCWLGLGRASAAINRLLITLACLNDATAVCIITLRGQRYNLAFQILVIVLL